MQPQTGTRSRQVRTPKAAPAFSAAVAKLIEQLQAEAREATLQSLSAKDGITVLHDLDPESKRAEFYGDELTVSDRRGSNISLCQRRFIPESWAAAPCMAGYWHPSHWEGSTTLVDGAGRRWNGPSTRYVCDDFGNLVELPE